MASNQVAKKTEQQIHWIHCNVCFIMYMRKERSLYLLACHHIVCENCKQDYVPKSSPKLQICTCPLCFKLSKFSEINNSMPKILKDLFHPEPWKDGLNNFQIMMFQSKHRQRYLDYLDAKFAKIQEHRKHITKLKRQAEATGRLAEEIKDERRHLENRVRLIQEQRRMSDDNNKNCLSNSISSSSSDRSSHLGRRVRPTPTREVTITSFTNLTPTHSFEL
ncbi:RING finger protein vilya-like isoform X1 [Stomoxys calcitrans]|uniref:RING finger protein vilya-like isoform X1 n=2 Tax=Stomoxys calcitrans TaxID=35570 RepID=UPI0027E352EF|nr:RING finger protein vilya-like isoform X1 [Stomoxys calcitrans]